MTRLLYADDRVRLTVDPVRVTATHHTGRTDTALLADPVDVARFYRWNRPVGMSSFDFHEALAAAARLAAA